MGDETGIGWTDKTMNFWIGCTEAGPGCVFCYARELDARYQWGVPAKERTPGKAPHWGDDAPRYRTAPANWRKPYAWNRDAQARGVPFKVFACSLADFFDKKVPPQWRADAWKVIRETPWLRWQIVTKRVSNIRKMLPPDWGETGYPNVCLIVTTVDQAEFDRDAPRLLAIPARSHGFSMEPQIGRIIVKAHYAQYPGNLWFITGGESRQVGVKDAAGNLLETRDYDIMWAYGLIRTANVATNMWVYVKQTGAKPRGGAGTIEIPSDGAGADPEAWPPWMRVQNFVPELLA